MATQRRAGSGSPTLQRNVAETRLLYNVPSSRQAAHILHARRVTCVSGGHHGMQCMMEIGGGDGNANLRGPTGTHVDE